MRSTVTLIRPQPTIAIASVPRIAGQTMYQESPPPRWKTRWAIVIEIIPPSMKTPPAEPRVAPPAESLRSATSALRLRQGDEARGRRDQLVERRLAVLDLVEADHACVRVAVGIQREVADWRVGEAGTEEVGRDR